LDLPIRPQKIKVQANFTKDVLATQIMAEEAQISGMDWWQG
jgi:hypothetical protein